MPYCPQCGQEVPEQANYCQDCGVALGASTDQGPQATPAVSSEARADLAGRTAINILIGGAVGFLGGLFVGAIVAPLYMLGLMVGCALAGYLQAEGVRAGAKVGGYAAILATAPILLLLVPISLFGLGTLVFGLPIGPNGFEFGRVWVAIFVGLFVAFLVLATNVLFGVLGGMVGGAIERQPRASSPPSGANNS